VIYSRIITLLLCGYVREREKSSPVSDGKCRKSVSSVSSSSYQSDNDMSISEESLGDVETLIERHKNPEKKLKMMEDELEIQKLTSSRGLQKNNSRIKSRTSSIIKKRTRNFEKSAIAARESW